MWRDEAILATVPPGTASMYAGVIIPPGEVVSITVEGVRAQKGINAGCS